MKLKGLTVDTSVTEGGDWIDIPGYPGLRIKSRSIDNKNYRNAYNKGLRKLRREHGNDIPVEKDDALRGECLARHCTLDWEGVSYEDGSACPFDVQTAVEAYTDPENAPLRDAAAFAAMAVAERARDEWESDLGNSEAASSGS